MTLLYVGSLFSGIGGIELGLHRAGGFRTRWFVEQDAFARAILARHFPNVPIFTDVRTINWRRLPRVDILTGGFPCQDASIANTKGKGVSGPRTGLWRCFRDAIRDLRPRYALIENVSNLRHRGLDRVLCDLAALGYDAEWCCLSAASLGAPHRRPRLFLLAYPHGTVMEGINPQHSASPRILAPSLSPSLMGEWQHELPAPALVGVGNGIPHRVDRTRCVGNASHRPSRN